MLEPSRISETKGKLTRPEKLRRDRRVVLGLSTKDREKNLKSVSYCTSQSREKLTVVVPTRERAQKKSRNDDADVEIRGATGEERMMENLELQSVKTSRRAGVYAPKPWSMQRNEV